METQVEKSETVQLTKFQKIMKFLILPGVIANLFNALCLDDKGYSLKKILAVHGTYIAGYITEKWACKENAIAFAILWLIWAGILVGIYSFNDITLAIAELRNSDKSIITPVSPTPPMPPTPPVAPTPPVPPIPPVPPVIPETTV